MVNFFEGARDALREIRDGEVPAPRALAYLLFVPLFIVGFFWCAGEIALHRLILCPRGEHVGQSLIKGRDTTCGFCGVGMVAK